MKIKKLPVIIFMVLSLSLISATVYFYQVFFSANLMLEQEQGVVYIPKGATMHQVLDSLKRYGYVNQVIPFMFVAKITGYQANVRHGRYVLTSKMSNYEAIRLLRGGQTPVRVTFNSARTLEDFSKKMSRYFEFSADSLLAILRNPEKVKELGFDTLSIKTMFVPNTYEFYWTTEPEEFLQKMKKEYDKFWTEARQAKAEKLNFSRLQVYTLASIVEAETHKNDEKAIIAGLYLNRLRREMPLGADPTIIYAHGDFTIKRVMHKHLEIDSPYNTYKYLGLPPAPINMPSVASIDAVLNYEQHQYLYMCAKEDFSGYHNFASSLDEHNRNAARYRKALDKAGIK